MSKRFKLGKSQSELDFVDVDYNKDTALFIDPYFLAKRTDRWSIEATRTIKSFFTHLITLLRDAKVARARQIFLHLSEPNENCLGLSKGRPEGRGCGRTDAERIFNSLLRSRAVKTGIVEDIEDCNIFVENFGKDKLSDMTTNIIRDQLIRYTQNQCRLCGIMMRPDVPSGFYWDRKQNSWYSRHTDMLVINSRKILLVPKGIVSFSDAYTPAKYYHHFLLNYLQNEHLRLNTALVQKRLRKGIVVDRYVTKKSLKEKVAPYSKDFLRLFTEDHPEVFKQFRVDAGKSLNSLGNEDLGDYQLDKIIDYLVDELSNIPPGIQHATQFHKTISGILELIFYPSMICPQIEHPIHQKRKFIDITFDNAATTGFFYDLHMTHKIPCAYVVVECKNYKNDPKNPELDQISNRFSPNRGKFGLLVCRKADDMKTLIQRCTDIYKDDRGLVIPLVLKQA